MPVMDGIRAISKIQEDPYKNSIPVIALSAKTGEKDKQYYLDLGFSDVIAKPFDIKDLINKIIKYTSSKDSDMDNVIKKIRPIEGINIREPLAAQNISVEEFYKNLYDFYQQNSSAIDKIKNAYNNKDNEALISLVRPLRESAKKTGAFVLYDVAGNFLSLLQEENCDTNCHFVFADLCFQLDKLMKDLSVFFSSYNSDGKTEKQENINSKYSQLIGNLHYYLEESNTKALNVVDDLLLLISSENKRKIITAIKNLCQRFDFDQALELYNSNRDLLDGSHD